MRCVLLAVTLSLLATGCGATLPAVEAVESQAFVEQAAPNCTVDWKTISTAIEAHYAQNMFDVTAIAELTPGYLREEPVGWTLTFDDAGVPRAVPTSDGPCATFESSAPSTNPPEYEPPTACDIEERTIETAIEAFIAIEGGAPTSIDDLVPNYLKNEPTGYEVVFDETFANPPVALPRPGGPCG